MPWDARAPKTGEKAPDLELLDEAGKRIPLSSIAHRRALVVLLLSGVRDEAALRLLGDYRDDTLAIWRAGARICAIAPASPAQLGYLRSLRGYAFPLLADPGYEAISTWGLSGKDAVFLLDRDLVVHHRGAQEAAAPDTILSILRRGGARRRRSSFSARFANFGHTVQHAFRTALRPARRSTS